MMKRLLLLSALLILLASFGRAQTHTDTLYFEFILEEGAGEGDSAIQYIFKNTVSSGIEMEYYDGQEHPRFTPGAMGKITVNGSGHGWIYYTYEESEGYNVRCSSRPGSDEDINIRSFPGVNITSLDVHACTALKYLLCYLNNRLTRLDARGCLKLEDLTCYKNQLTELDITGCTALKYLGCYENRLTNLDVSGNTLLETLYCYDNQLIYLDLSQNPALMDLNCDDNQLTDLDVSHNPGLRELNCSYNQLTSLSVNSDLTRVRCENNHLPLSMLYDIYTQASWNVFSADPQTDTVALAGCEAWDLSSEKALDGTATTFEMKEKGGREASDAYLEDDFSFLFKGPFTGTLTLQNNSIPDVSMTYHITAEECAPDTLYFEFALEEGETSATIEYGFSEAVLPGSIQMEYYDGQAHAKFTLTASGSITVNGNGHGRIYYTHEESAGYTACFSSRLEDRDIRVLPLSGVHLTSLDVHACDALTYLDCMIINYPH